MTMESDVYQALAAVSAAYPVSLPPSPTLPSVSYRFLSGVQMRHHGGNDMVRRRLQVDCWARSYTAAWTLAYNVKAALDLRETSPFKLITLENPGMDLSDPEAGIFHQVLEFYVWE